MAKGFGIAALVFALLAVFIPVPVNVYMVGLVLILATVSAVAGDKPLTIAALLISGVNIVILSPVTMRFIRTESNGDTVALVLIVLFIAPIAAMILNANGTINLDRENP